MNNGNKRGWGLHSLFPSLKGSTGQTLIKNAAAEGGVQWTPALTVGTNTGTGYVEVLPSVVGPSVVFFTTTGDTAASTIVAAQSIFANGGMQLGAGGASATDTFIQRQAAGVVSIGLTNNQESGALYTARLGLGSAPPSVSGTRATVPPTQATIATALGSIALGTALHNTLSYDVRAVVYIPVTASTNGTILVGVGTTTTPTQVTVVAASALTGIIQVSATIPAGQYILVSKGGTSTVGTPVTYWEAA